MKFNSFFLLSFILILFISCSNSAVSDKLLHSENLKSITDSKRSELQWTLELEKNRLSERITSIEYINQNNRLTPAVLMAFEAGNERQPLYPELKGFGSLDISDVDPNVVSIINQFCRSLINNEECEVLFDDDSVYSLVLFTHDISNYDLRKNWWYIGKSYFEGGAIEVPVRLTNGQSFLDFKVYLKEKQLAESKSTQNTNNSFNDLAYKIIDVEIIDSGNIN